MRMSPPLRYHEWIIVTLLASGGCCREPEDVEVRTGTYAMDPYAIDAYHVWDRGVQMTIDDDQITMDYTSDGVRWRVHYRVQGWVGDSAVVHYE